jgi:acetyl-CoA carboxylase biotin carboxyl carrier protein
MDLDYVEKLIKLLSENDVDEIEIEEEGKSIRVAKNAAPVAPVFHAAPAGASAGSTHVTGGTAPSNPAAPSAAEKLHEIKSPIVGTFYPAPAPDAAPFVQVGSLIEPGTVLCIVEAMKLMNEIEADVSGKIVKVLAETGQPVEYDQTLFLVQPSPAT